ncbi:hypothetical protein Mgra_00007219, partial [Meloidogyne graminicola]
ENIKINEINNQSNIKEIKTTKLPLIPKIVLPIKQINKNSRHINNPKPIPILIGNQKIIIISTTSSTPKISTKTEENKNKQNIILTTTTTIKPLIYMKTLIQRKNKNINLNNNTINNKVILTENSGSIWLDGNIPSFNSTAKWSNWSEWGECFCGKQMRSRTCIYENNNSFHSQGCLGKSYESKNCILNKEQCPTTIPPIPPSKLQLINKKEKPSFFKRNSLNITPLKIKNEGQNHQRENELLKHKFLLTQRHRMFRHKN